MFNKYKFFENDQDDSQINEQENENIFSLEELSSINSFKGRLAYCNLFLKRIAAGSSRVVFDYIDNKVLKVAKNEKGLAQIEAEKSFSNDKIDIFAKIYDYDKDNKWLIMQKAKKATAEDIKNITGFKRAYIFIYFIEYLYYKRFPYKDKYNYSKSYTNQYKEIFEKKIEEDYENYGFSYYLDLYFGDYEPEIGDYKRLANWGVVINEETGEKELVIIDYGYNEDVKKLYSRHH